MYNVRERAGERVVGAPQFVVYVLCMMVHVCNKLVIVIVGNVCEKLGGYVVELRWAPQGP